MLSTLGSTCVAFVTGALAWWGPKFMYYGLRLKSGGDVKLDERNTAEAFQILLSHAFGAAGSPYLSGVISEYLKITLAHKLQHNVSNFGLSPQDAALTSTKDDDTIQFESLQYALFITRFV